MRIKKNILSICAIATTFLFSAPLHAADKTITLLSDAGDDTVVATLGNTFTVQVQVADVSTPGTEDIAGAAFTITYDTSNLDLTGVTSSFFDTFTSQGITTPNSDGSVTVDSVNYYSPIVENQATSGSMLAAARVDNGPSGTQVIFTLTFNTTGTRGNYPISVAQSVISNTAAGYDENGEFIPFFVGISGDTYPTHDVTTITGLTATVAAEDFDGDGIADEWELDYLPDGANPSDSDALDYYTATGDYDGDGYSDLVEYQNRDLTDLDGSSAYDPAYINTPGGPGWKSKVNIIPTLLPILLDD